MNDFKSNFLLLSSLLFFGCSTITSKDCQKDMYQFGHKHGSLGLTKNYLEDIRDTCLKRNPTLDLSQYQKGFEIGWKEFCTPMRGFEMGRRSDPYIQFCPADKEEIFHQRYLMGTRYYELKDLENELSHKIEELKDDIDSDASTYGQYIDTRNELEKIQQEMQALLTQGRAL